MIQRVQSVFLLLVAIAMICLFFLPVWSKTDAAGVEYVLDAYKLAPVTAPATGEVLSKNTIFIALLAGAAALVALFSIFQYKNRLTQMKLGALNSLLMAVLMFLCFYYAMMVGEDLVKGATAGSKEAGFFLPALGLILNVLANRFIKRDEELVRSMDRLR